MEKMTQEEIGLKRISPSMLVEYENCPRLFFYRSWLGLKLPQAMRHLNFGTAIHAGIDNMYEQYDDKDGWALAEFKIAKDEFLKHWKINMISDEDAPTQEEKDTIYKEMKADGVEMLKSLWNEKEVLAAKGVLPDKMEIPLKLIFSHPVTGEKLPIPLSGRIDGMSDSRIIEFKTSGNKYKELETRDSMQALSYVALWYAKKETLPDAVDYLVLLKKRKKDRVQHLHYEYDLSDLGEYFERVKDILQKVKNREFQKPLKNHPYFCDCDKYYEALNYEDNYNENLKQYENKNSSN